VPNALIRAARAGVLASLFLGACASPQDIIQQQREKLASLGASTALVARGWLDGHVSGTYAGTALEALLAQVEQQRAVIAQKPRLLVDPQGAALSQQAEQLSRLLAQMQHDVEGGDASSLRGRLSSLPGTTEAK
jgi:hypothetical protein